MWYIRMSIKWLFIFCVLCSTVQLLAIGDATETVPSLEAFARIPPAMDVIYGFAKMANGFSLQDSETECFFRSYFPLGTSVILNGGTLYAQADVVIDSITELTSAGMIEGMGKEIHFRPRIELLDLPSFGKISNAISATGGATVYTIDWSYDDNYLALGTALQASAELRIYPFDGTIFGTAVTLETGVTINQLRWQPLAPMPYYFVTATTSDLRAYQFTPGLPGTITETSTIVTGNICYAVAWHPNGDKVIVSKNDTSSELEIYNFSGGTLSPTGITANIDPNRTPQLRALDWETVSGEYVAVGVSRDGTNPELLIYKYDGSSLTLLSSASIFYNDAAITAVTSVKWSHDGSLLAVGLNGSSERLRMYSFDRTAETLTELTSYRIGEASTVYAINWNNDDSRLAVGRGTGITYQLRLFKVNHYADRLLISAEASPGGATAVWDVAWRHNDNFVASTNNTNASAYGFSFTDALIFNNANLVVNSPVRLQSAVTFQGDCTIDGFGYILDMNGNTITIDDDASLSLKNIILDGLSGTNLQCSNSTAVVSFDNVTCHLNNDFTFNEGIMKIVGNLFMTSPYTFTYSSDEQSTIYEHAQWKLDSGMTFSYAPAGASADRLVFENELASLYLYETTLVADGLVLTKGTLTVDGECPVVSGVTGITLGDGTNISNNMSLNILPESGLYLLSGQLTNNNVN